MGLYRAYVKDVALFQSFEQVMDRIVPINWEEVILDLVRMKMSLTNIGLIIGVSHETVRGWRSGSIPNHEAGRKLLVLREEAKNRGMLDRAILGVTDVS